MDYLEYLYLINVMSHTDSEYHFKKTGIHRIKGGNSNGKSVLVKALCLLFQGKYLELEERETIIRDGSPAAVICAVAYNGMSLTAFVHREFGKGYFELEWGNEKVRKHFNDDYKPLIRAANFHYSEELDYSLNIYRTKTTIPFAYTSGTFNHKILESASEVPKVRRAIFELKEQLQAIEADKKLVERKILSINELLKTIKVSNTERLERELAIAEASRESYHRIISIKESLDSIKSSRDILKASVIIDYTKANDKVLSLKDLHSAINTSKVIKDSKKSYESLSSSLGTNPRESDDSVSDLKSLREVISISSSIVSSRKSLYDNRDIVHIPNLQDTFSALHAISSISSMRSDIEKSRSVLFLLDGSLKFNPYEIPPETLEIMKNLRSCIDTVRSIKETSENIQSLTEQRDLLDMELVEINKAIGICPECGGKINVFRHKMTG